RLKRAIGVCENEGMLTVLLLEKVEDALMLHQPRNEIEVGLAILNAVVPLHMRAPRLIPVVDYFGIHAFQLVKNSLHDVNGGHVLKDLAVGTQGKQTSPGD